MSTRNRRGRSKIGLLLVGLFVLVALLATFGLKNDSNLMGKLAVSKTKKSKTPTATNSISGQTSTGLTYKPYDNDVAVENLTVAVRTMDYQGTLMPFAFISGKLVNRGRNSVVVSPDNLKILPDAKGITTELLKNSGKISEEMASALGSVEQGNSFTCIDNSESLNADCTLTTDASDNTKTFSFSQPVYFATTTGSAIVASYGQSLTSSEGTAVTDGNMINNTKVALIYPPAASDPDIMTQGLSATPVADASGKVTGLEVTGYVINSSADAFVSGIKDGLTFKVNNKTQAGVTVTMDYSEASTEWKEAVLKSLEKYKTAYAAAEDFFAALPSDTLYPGGGKAYFKATVSATNLKTGANVLMATAPLSYKMVAMPTLDTNGNGKLETSEVTAQAIKTYQDALTSISWQTANDSNEINNAAYLLVKFGAGVKKGGLGSVQIGEQIGTLWEILTGLASQYEWSSQIVPDDWAPGVNFPDLPSELPGNFSPEDILALINTIITNYDSGSLAEAVSSAIVNKINNFKDFINEKKGLPELASTGIVKFTPATGVYDFFVFNLSSKEAGKFDIRLNIAGKKELTQSVDGLKAFGFKKLTFTDKNTQPDPAGNLLLLEIDTWTTAGDKIKERNEYNNKIYQELIIDNNNTVWLPIKKYAQESAKMIHSFFYISYPFAGDGWLYFSNTYILKGLLVQNWLIPTDKANNGVFRARVAGKDKNLTCASQETSETSYMDKPWEKYKTIQFAFGACDLSSLKGRPVILELQRRYTGEADFSTIAQRTLTVPLYETLMVKKYLQYQNKQ